MIAALLAFAAVSIAACIGYYVGGLKDEIANQARLRRKAERDLSNANDQIRNLLEKVKEKARCARHWHNKYQDATGGASK